MAMSVSIDSVPARSTSVLLACAFRPFFLLTALYAMVLITAWLGVWFRGWPLTGQAPLLHWHAHEMLFGMVAAAIAGFLLTAMANWTGTRPLAGVGLAFMLLLWVVGRVAMWMTTYLPPIVILIADAAFFLALTVFAARVIERAGNRRNRIMILILALLLLANVLSHLGMWWLGPAWMHSGERLAFFLVVLLMVIIGGRITPAFTRNWLMRQGRPTDRIRSWPMLDHIAVGTVALLALAAVFNAPGQWLSGIALLAGLSNGLRLLGWSGWQGRSDPLIWVLHLGHAWIVIGLLILGAGLFVPDWPQSAWLHALGTGAMGTLILGVMTRVALGHTGRELKLPRLAWLIYLAISLAAVVRVLSALGWLEGRVPLMLAAVGWVVAFGLFLVLYGPVLSAPRVDGKDG